MDPCSSLVGGRGSPLPSAARCACGEQCKQSWCQLECPLLAFLSRHRGLWGLSQGQGGSGSPRGCAATSCWEGAASCLVPHTNTCLLPGHNLAERSGVHRRLLWLLPALPAAKGAGFLSQTNKKLFDFFLLHGQTIASPLSEQGTSCKRSRSRIYFRGSLSQLSLSLQCQSGCFFFP